MKLMFGEVDIFVKSLRYCLIFVLPLPFLILFSSYYEIVVLYLHYTLWLRYSFHTGCQHLFVSRANNPSKIVLS